MLQTKLTMLAALVGVSLLSGCGDSTTTIIEKDPIAVDDDHDHDAQGSAGRLVISAINNDFVQVLALPEKTELDTFLVAASPSAIVASGDHRYAAVVQRNQDLVHFIDGGLWQEDHIDHMDNYQTAPRLMPFQLTQVRPTHFSSAAGQLAVFFDGNAETGAAAGVAVLTDADIGADSSEYPQLSLTTHQHGAAQARGEYLLSTLRDANSSTSLQEQVGLYHQHGNHYDLEEVFAVNCPNLHGSAQNHDFIAFGCTDGVLLIEQVGDIFTASKLANTTDFTGTMRIGTLAGDDAAEHFIGIAGSAVFAIHAEDAEMELLDWQPGTATSIWGYGFAEQSEKFVLLDNSGTLTIFNYLGHGHTEGATEQAAFTFAAKLPLTAANLADLPVGARFQLAISAADDKIYVTDPIVNQLHTIDLHDAKVVNTKQLSFTPHRLTWLGIANPSAEQHGH